MHGMSLHGLRQFIAAHWPFEPMDTVAVGLGSRDAVILDKTREKSET